MESNLYYHIQVNDAYTITDRPCILHAITVNLTSAGTITILDGSDVVGILKGSVLEGTYLYDICIKNSLGIITADTSDITVAYHPSA